MLPLCNCLASRVNHSSPDPKPVALRHHNAIALTKTIVKQWGILANEHSYCLLKLSHNIFVHFIISCYFLFSLFVYRSLRLLRFLVTILSCFSQNVFYAFLFFAMCEHTPLCTNPFYRLHVRISIKRVRSKLSLLSFDNCFKLLIFQKCFHRCVVFCKSKRVNIWIQT